MRKSSFISSRNLVLALGTSFVLPPGLCVCTVKKVSVFSVSVRDGSQGLLHARNIVCVPGPELAP